MLINVASAARVAECESAMEVEVQAILTDLISHEGASWLEELAADILHFHCVP